MARRERLGLTICIAGIVDGALGLLLSYTWLIRWESDHKIAQDLGLLPSNIQYQEWIDFSNHFLSTYSRDQIVRPWLHWRYDYAEIRLNRINLIWRLRP